MLPISQAINRNRRNVGTNAGDCSRFNGIPVLPIEVGERKTLRPGHAPVWAGRIQIVCDPAGCALEPHLPAKRQLQRATSWLLWLALVGGRFPRRCVGPRAADLRGAGAALCRVAAGRLRSFVTRRRYIARRLRRAASAAFGPY